MSFWDDVFGATVKSSGEKTTTSSARAEQAAPNYALAPEYDETGKARKSWFDSVQAFGQMPGYGAIAPDWADIWEKSRKKVDQYYLGTATKGGAIDRVKASAARRGVSDSPALESQLGAMGVEAGGQIENLARDQAIAEAQFGEQGRQNWLQQIMALAGLGGPGGQWWTPWKTETGTENTKMKEKKISTDSPYDNVNKVGQQLASLFSGLGGGGGMTSMFG